MKIVFALLLFLIFISCTSNTTEGNKKNQAILTNPNITDNINIYGSWAMCSTSGNGNMTQYNVCPIVSFNYNGTGSVWSNASSMIEFFNWTLKKGVLIISYTRQRPNNTFPDRIYLALINKKNNNFDLSIRQEKQGYSFYLSK